MIVKCEKCLEKIRERPPYGGLDGKFDTVVIWGICPECQKKYFETPSQEEHKNTYKGGDEYGGEVINGNHGY